VVFIVETRSAPAAAGGTKKTTAKVDRGTHPAAQLLRRRRRLGWRCRGRLRLHHGGRRGLRCFLGLTRRELRQLFGCQVLRLGVAGDLPDGPSPGTVRLFAPGLTVALTSSITGVTLGGTSL